MSLDTLNYMSLSELSYMIDESMKNKTLNYLIDNKQIKENDLSKLTLSPLKSTSNSLHSYKLLDFSANYSSGFAAAAFQSPTGEVVFSFKGTDAGDIVELYKDIANADEQIFTGFTKTIPAQFADAEQFVNRVLENNSNVADYTFTGHSLGGALAQYMTYKTGRSSTTFNAPGIGSIIQSATGVDVDYAKYKNKSVNYANESDLIGNYRNHTRIGTNRLVRSNLNNKIISDIWAVVKMQMVMSFKGDTPEKRKIMREGRESLDRIMKNSNILSGNHGMEDMLDDDGFIMDETKNRQPIDGFIGEVVEGVSILHASGQFVLVPIGNTIGVALYYSGEGVYKFFDTSGYITGGLIYHGVDGVKKFIDTSEYILGGMGYYSMKGIEEFFNTSGNLIASGLWNGFNLLSKMFSEGMRGILSLFNSAVAAPRVPRVDPLILDLNGDRSYTINLERSRAYFDLDANGFAERVAWVDPNDALLVLDRDNDGKITSGQELFGDQTILSNGNKATSGFEALAEFDDNRDGKIDAKDIVYAKLRLWQDANGDGVSQADELKSLADAGIVTINLNSNVVNSADVMGNVQRRLGSFIKSDGSGGQIAEYLLNRDTLDSLDLLNQNISIPEDVAALPNLQGAGNMTSLHVAMVKDESGELKRLLLDFFKPENAMAREKIFADILYKWAEVGDINPNSRGRLVDAQHLAILEKLMGMKFIGSEGENPNTNAAPLLKKAYSKLFDRLYTHLASGTFLKELLSKIDYKVVESSVVIDLSKVRTEIDAQLAADADLGKQMLSDIARALNGYDLEEREVVTEFINHFALKSSELAGVVYRIYEGAVIGGDDADQLNGTAGSDILVGGTGNDWLYGYAGNDTLVGGAGNDRLEGGEGDDTYIFNRGDGRDIIHDTGGSDTIQLGEGISLQDLKFTRADSAGSSLMIAVGTDGDYIEVNNYFSEDSYDRQTDKYKIEKIVLADGTIIDRDYIYEQVRTVTGTEKGDVIQGYADQDNIIYGLAAGDTIHGHKGNDLLYGDDGNDWLYGYAGNDTLVGGAGNDRLEGGEGDDTYIFNRGDGRDRIFDANGLADEVRLGHESIDVVFERVNSSLRVRMPGSLDTITIDSWYNGDAYKIETFKSTDGNVITHTQIESLIQAMASFHNDTGMTWEQALSEQPSQVRSIVQEYWTVPTV